MIHGGRWAITGFVLLAGLMLMLGVVFGFNAANTVLTALGTIGALIGLLVQVMSAGEQGSNRSERETSTASSPLEEWDGGPWLVLIAGLTLIVVLGGTLAILRPKHEPARGGNLRITVDTEQPRSVDSGGISNPMPLTRTSLLEVGFETFVITTHTVRFEKQVAARSAISRHLETFCPIACTTETTQSLLVGRTVPLSLPHLACDQVFTWVWAAMGSSSPLLRADLNGSSHSM